MSPMRRRGVFLTGTRAQQSRSRAPMHLDYQPNGALRQVPMAQLPRISVALSGPPTASVIKVSKESTNRAICLFPPGGETAHYQRRGQLATIVLNHRIGAIGPDWLLQRPRQFGVDRACQHRAVRFVT
jgi:hypothetical protein